MILETVKNPNLRITPNLEIFRGPKNPLSNFFETNIQIEDLHFISIEHVYQYTKAKYHGLNDLAIDIQQAKSPRNAQLLGNTIVDIDNEWNKDKLEAKYEQCPGFVQKIHNTSDKLLVEGTKNLFWASGLLPGETASTPIQDWPGLNHLGYLLVELRAKLSQISGTSNYPSN